MTDEAQVVVVSDTNVLVNLMHVSRLDFCGRLLSHRFVVPEEVVEEILVPEQKTALQQAIKTDSIGLEPVTTVEALALFGALRERFGRGESAALALAATRRWLLACDEKRRFLKIAEEHLGVETVLRTEHVFELAIKAGLLTVEEADADKATLETHRYKMSFDSFRNFLKVVA
jgi:predicted nucleic acid-binding protein